MNITLSKKEALTLHKALTYAIHRRIVKEDQGELLDKLDVG